MASTAVRTSLTAVTMITARRSSRARIWGRKVGPGGPGIRTSSRTTSTRRERRAPRPLAPSSASRTSNSPSRMTWNDSRTPCSSSMTSATGLGRDGSESALMGSGPVRDLEDDVLAAGPAPRDLHGHSLARLQRGHRFLELFDAADSPAVDLEDEIALLDAGRGRRAAGRHVGDHDARARAQPERLGRVLAELLDRHPEALAPRSGRDHRLLTRLLSDRDRELGVLAVAQYRERDGATRREGGQAALGVGHLLDRNATQLDDDVTRLHAGRFGRAVLQHVRHQHAALAEGPEAGGEVVRQILDGDAEPAAHHPALRDELGHDLARHVDRNGEPDALTRRHDGGIDADDAPVEVEQRPARVAGVDGGIS